MKRWYFLAIFFGLMVITSLPNAIGPNAKEGGLGVVIFAAALSGLGIYKIRQGKRKAQVAQSVAQVSAVDMLRRADASTERERPSAGPEVEVYGRDDPKRQRAFQQAFTGVIGTLQPFSAQEIQGIYSMTASSVVNFWDLAAWNCVFEPFFAHRDIVWPELDSWNEIFVRYGRKPIWRKFVPEEATLEDMTGKLTVPELKEVLQALGLKYASKDKKPDLIAALGADISPEQVAAACPIWRDKAYGLQQKNRRQLFELITRTVSGRASSLMQRAQLDELGVAYKIVTSFPEDEPYIKLALERNPNALPPLYPSDRSHMSGKFNGQEWRGLGGD